MYISIFPHHTPSYCKINLQNNHTSGDRYIGDHVVADTLTFHVHVHSAVSECHSHHRDTGDTSEAFMLH